MPQLANEQDFHSQLATDAKYLRAELQTIPDVIGACLIGSRLEREAFTRFSDTDLIVFTHSGSYSEFWSALTAKLREQVPGLILHLENPEGLELRAPLLVHRLLSEQYPVFGSAPADFLSLPNPALLRAQAGFRTQEIVGALQTQLSEHHTRAFDPTRDAWILRKFLVEVLRYQYLIQGPAATSLGKVLHRALNDPALPEDIHSLLRELHQTASESLDPQFTPEEVRAWFRKALAFIRSLQTSLH